MVTEGGEAVMKDDTHEESSDGEREDTLSMPAEHWASVSHPGCERPHSLHHSETDSGIKVTAAEQTILAAVAASIIHSTTGMSSWGLAELTLGLYKVFCRHNRERAIDTIAGHLVTSTKELQDISHYLKWAKAAYQENIELVAKELEVEEKDIVKQNVVAAFGQPSYFIGLNHAKKAVVLSIRGTHSALDVLTDLKPHGEPFGDGHAHSGMLNSAKWVQETTLETLKKLIEQNARLQSSEDSDLQLCYTWSIIFNYRLVVTGHSLGAGAASLLTMLLRKADEKGLTVLGVRPELITSWGYGCPPCVDKATAEKAKFIKNIVHQDDIIARISPAAIEDLRSEIEETDWRHALEDGSTRRKVVQLVQSSTTIIDKLEPALNLEKGQLVTTVKDQSWSALVSIGNGLAETWSRAVAGAYGTTYGQAATVVNKGVLVAASQATTVHSKLKSTVNGAIDYQLRLITQDKKDATVTASSMAAEAAVTSQKEARALLEKNRLFIPGILYHVIRRPLTAEEKPPKDEPEKKCSSEAPTYRCLVIRGDHPSSGFRRIVLSSTIISDHMLLPLENSLSNYAK